MNIVAGIDIGGTLTKFGLVNSEGEVVAYREISTDTSGPAAEYFQTLNAAVMELFKSANESGDLKLKGIGMGAPNANFFEGTIEDPPNLDWKGVVPAVELMQRDTVLPVVLTNDANAAAIGELEFGAAQGMKDFLVITLGTGLGSGLVANGQLVYGHDGFAGELGHTIAEYGGRPCKCGRRGCLETYASATGIVHTVREWLESTEEESLLRAQAEGDGPLSARDITEAAEQGDAMALRAFDFTGEMLGRKLADVVALFSPEAIILSGGLARAGRHIFEPTQKYMEAHMLGIFKDKVKLLPSGLPETNTAVLGAAALIRNYLNKGKMLI